MSVFKAYDIRGIAGDELDVDFSERLGKAIATHLGAKSVSVVRDIRDSSPSYHEAFVRGLREAGADVIDGQCCCYNKRHRCQSGSTSKYYHF